MALGFIQLLGVTIYFTLVSTLTMEEDVGFSQLDASSLHTVENRTRNRPPSESKEFSFIRITTIRHTINWSNVKLFTDKKVIKKCADYLEDIFNDGYPGEANVKVKRVWFTEYSKHKKNQIRMAFQLRAFNRLYNYTATVWVNPKKPPKFDWFDLYDLVDYQKFKLKWMDILEKYLKFYK